MVALARYPTPAERLYQLAQDYREEAQGYWHDAGKFAAKAQALKQLAILREREARRLEDDAEALEAVPLTVRIAE